MATTTDAIPVAKTPATHQRGIPATSNATVVDRTAELSDEMLAAVNLDAKMYPAACAQVADHFRRHGSRPFQWSNDLQPHAPKPTDTPRVRRRAFDKDGVGLCGVRARE
jgi:hypothetical protein